MGSFAAIDFETVNQYRTSASSIVAVHVLGGKIASVFYNLIRPYSDFYSRICTRVYGSGTEDTDGAKTFNPFWLELEDCIKVSPFVSHRVSFCASVLRITKILKHYRLVRTNLFLCILKTVHAKLTYILVNLRWERAQSYFTRKSHNALGDTCTRVALHLFPE